MNSFIAEINNGSALLTEEESWHCAKVLRKKPGEIVRVIDGKGGFAQAKLELVSEKQTTAKILGELAKQQRRGYYLHVAIAPTKQIDRIEWMIEKMVEVGIDEISFLECTNSERRVIKTERIKKIVESAVKQSLQALIPKVNEMLTLKQFTLSNTANQKFIAHCFDTPKKEIKTIDFKNKSSVILIGPEGDFTEKEVQMCTNQNFEAISLGTTRLRSETAGLYACQAVSILQQ